MRELYEYIKEEILVIEPNITITKDDYYRNHKFDGEVLEIDSLPWYEHGSIVEISYNREIDRYGGEKAIINSETIFNLSSELTLHLIKVANGSFIKKVMLSVATTMLFIKKFLNFKDINEDVMYLKYYRTYWEGFKDDKVAAEMLMTLSLNSGNIFKAIKTIDGNSTTKGLLNEIDQEIEKIRELVNDEEYVHAILASHIHMTNNRLGVPPVIEYCIAEYLANNIQEGGELVGA